MKPFALACLFTLALAPLSAQAPPPPRFEVASIKPSGDQPPTPGTAGMRVTQQQANFSFLSLKDYIGMAYEARVYQIAAPDWVASTRFEIVAKVPDGVSPKELPAMMRALLEERFHIRVHHEQREFSVYAIETTPQFTLEPIPSEAVKEEGFAVTSTAGPGGGAVDLGEGAAFMYGNNRIEFRKVTFPIFAGVVERFVERPVVDQSGREGRFNMAFDLTPDDFHASMIRMALAAGVTLPPAAMRLLDAGSVSAVPDALKALGIVLQSRKAPLDVLVVDSMDRMPTEN